MAPEPGTEPPHQHVLSLTMNTALPWDRHSLLHVLDDMNVSCNASTMSVVVESKQPSEMPSARATEATADMSHTVEMRICVGV